MHNSIYYIRSAIKNDMPDLLRMHDALINHIYRCNSYIWQLSEDRKRRQPIFYEKINNNPNGQIFIAVNQSTDEVVGMICGWVVANDIFRHPASGRIEDLWVEPNSRRNGIGSDLLKSIVNFFKDQKISELSVDYAFGNNDADKFWSKAGFNKAIVMSNAKISQFP